MYGRKERDYIYFLRVAEGWRRRRQQQRRQRRQQRRGRPWGFEIEYIVDFSHYISSRFLL